VKNGLNVVLQPVALRSTMLERLADRGHITPLERVVLQGEHQARRDLFFKNIHSWRATDICPRAAFENFIKPEPFTTCASRSPSASLRTSVATSWKKLPTSWTATRTTTLLSSMSSHSGTDATRRTPGRRSFVSRRNTRRRILPGR
jgi:hypothetical protein